MSHPSITRRPAPATIRHASPSRSPKTTATASPLKAVAPVAASTPGKLGAVRAQGSPPAPVVQGAPSQNNVAEPVSRFIELEIEARKCRDIDALRFAIVNSPRQIAKFDQAFLAELGSSGAWAITRASSVTKVDRHTHLVRGLDAWLQHPDNSHLIARAEPRLANLEQEARNWGLNSKVFSMPHAFWLPINAPDGRPLAALLLLKYENWRPQHTALMIPLADAYGHAWDALAPKCASGLARVQSSVSRSRIVIGAAILSLMAAFIPVPMSALAPAEVIAVDPMLVTAPIEGVIKEILAAPGTFVEQGTPIVKFADVKLRNDVEVAGRNMAVAKAKHFKIVQSATLTQKDMQDLATAKAELDVAEAEFVYANELLQRSTIRADRSGLLIYASKSDWVGKPVAVGERLMEIGDPSKSELKIELPVSDAIALKSGGAVALFLDGNPLRSIAGTIIRTSYRPASTTEQQLAFRIHAKFDDGTPRRLGLRGVARISGESVSLWFYLLRRPLSALRQRVGL